MTKCFARLIKANAVVVLFYFIVPLKAYAYLDPGTGSYIFQLIIAVFIGGLFAAKLFWNKIKIFLKNLFSRVEKLEKA